MRGPNKPISPAAPIGRSPAAAQVLFAMNGRYLINEKGALDEAAAFPITIAGMRERVASVWEAIGRRAYATAFRELRAFERDLKALL